MRVKYTIEIKGGEQDGRIESGETGFLIALAGDTNKHGDLLSEKIHVVGPASMQDILQITMGFVGSVDKCERKVRRGIAEAYVRNTYSIT